MKDQLVIVKLKDHTVLMVSKPNLYLTDGLKRRIYLNKPINKKLNKANNNKIKLKNKRKEIKNRMNKNRNL